MTTIVLIFTSYAYLFSSIQKVFHRLPSFVIYDMDICIWREKSTQKKRTNKRRWYYA